MSRAEKKHNRHVDDLVVRLSKKYWVESIRSEVPYPNGRPDIWLTTIATKYLPSREIYIEVKGKYSDKLHRKAKTQVHKWKDYFQNMYPNSPLIGMYWDPKCKMLERMHPTKELIHAYKNNLR